MINEKIKVIIPARYASSRLPGKPLLKLSNKAIINHVVDRCIEAGFATDNIIVASDDDRILAEAQLAGVSSILTNKTHSSGTDRIAEVADKLALTDDVIVLNVQGDEPLIPPDLIRSVASFALEHDCFDIVTAVTRFASYDDFANPNHVKAVLADSGQALYFTRAMSPYNRDSPDSYSLAYRHVGIYAYRCSALRSFCVLPESALEKYEKLEQLRALEAGMKIGATVYNDLVPHGVDTLSDYESLLSRI